MDENNICLRIQDDMGQIAEISLPANAEPAGTVKYLLNWFMQLGKDMVATSAENADGAPEQPAAGNSAPKEQAGPEKGRGK